MLFFFGGGILLMFIMFMLRIFNTKATVGWSLEWRIFGERFLWSRLVGKYKIKKILAYHFFFS